MPRGWNVVVTLAPEGYRDAVRILRDFGEISKTPFRDVLVMRVDLEAREFLEKLRELLSGDKTLANAAARVIPVTETFSFSTAEEFRSGAMAAVRPWARELAGKTFHVRMHRRGFGDTLQSQAEERALGEFLLDHVGGDQEPAHVDFDDPDIVIGVETVGEEVGVCRWSRSERERYELLRFD